MRRFYLFSIALIISSFSFAQKIDWKRIESISSDGLSSVYSDISIYPSWIGKSDYISYDVKENNTNVYYLISARTGKKERLIKDVASFCQQYQSMTGDTTINKNNFKIYGFVIKDNDPSCFYWEKKNKWMVYDRKTGILKLGKSPNKKEEKNTRYRFSDTSHTSDSIYTILGSGYNLFVRNNQTKSIHQVTFDGKEGNSYTNRFAKDTLETNTKGQWIGHRYMCMMQDVSEIKDLYIINSLDKPRPTLKTVKMPMPGDSGIKRFSIWWYNADTNEGKLLPIDKYPDQFIDRDFHYINNYLYFTRRSRKADKIDLCRVDIITGKIQELITEECKPHMNLSLFNYKLVKQGNKIIWWSERTGKGNYYLYDSNGKYLNRITQGDHLVAGNIANIDTIKNEIIFAAYGSIKGINPYYTHYYKVKLNGKEQTLLTPGDGDHEISFSANMKYAIDQYSRMDMPTHYNVINLKDPQKVFLFGKINDASLKEAGWRPPVLIKLKAADKKTDLYGIMYLPSNLDVNKKYPIISNVYPGPQDDQIPKSFTIDDNGNQSLAELGFVVINVADRGSSPWRGHDFYCFSYGNLRDYPLADDKYVIEQLAKEYSYIDLDRVGIYGHSGGGFQTVAAMLTYPDFYKVGVAASGNHDNNIYIQWWGETFHGLEEKTDSTTGKVHFSSHIPTNMELAGNLKGRLLLCTGDVDDNVPCSSTLRMANALIEKNKRFDMFIFPGKDHGVTCPYYQNLIRYYFVENLINPTIRDMDIVNHK